MNKIKERKFRDNESGITSELIDGATDVNILLNWKMIVESNIVSAQMKIDIYKGEHAKTGVYADPDKWVGINGYRRALGFLSQKIQHKLRELNYNKKNQDNYDYEGFYFQAKQVLPSDVFNVIMKLNIKEK